MKRGASPAARGGLFCKRGATLATRSELPKPGGASPVSRGELFAPGDAPPATRDALLGRREVLLEKRDSLLEGSAPSPGTPETLRRKSLGALARAEAGIRVKGFRCLLPGCPVARLPGCPVARLDIHRVL